MLLVMLKQFKKMHGQVCSNSLGLRCLICHMCKIEVVHTVHRGAFLTIFVRISTDKQNTWIFGNFSDQLDEILKDSCDFWRFLEIFGLKVWNFST